MANESYEFTPEQSDILKRLSRLMKLTGILFIFLGVIIGTLCSFTITHNPPLGYICLFLTIMAVSFGVWTNNISYSFRLIIETTGRDIDLLMEALKSMKHIYILQFIWLLMLTLLFLFVLVTTTIPGFQII